LSRHSVALNPAGSASLDEVTIGRIFWLRTDKPNRYGACPVSLRITLPGHKNADHGTGVSCHPDHWAGAEGKKSVLKKSHPDFEDADETLTGLRKNAKTAQRRLEAMGSPVTPQAVVALLKNPNILKPGPEPCVLEFMENEIETHYLAGNRGTYEAARAIVRKFRGWWGEKRAPLEALTAEQMQKLYKHLLGAEARGGEISTANKAIMNLTGFFRRGIPLGMWSEAENPFRFITKSKALKRQKVRLTKAEHHAVIALDLPVNKPLWKARAVFLLQFYLRGERIGACLLLRWESLRQHGTQLRYQAQKNGPFKQVPVRPELAAILAVFLPRQAQGEAFILPYLPKKYDRLNAEQQLSCIKRATSAINKNLKAVARLADIDKPLKSHAARHTFATLAAKVIGREGIRPMLGHTTQRQTDNYIADLDFDEVDVAANAAFDAI
jgi:integrase